MKFGEWLTWLSFPVVVRQAIGKDDKKQQMAIAIAERGPRSKELVEECVCHKNGVSRVSLAVLHWAIVEKSKPMPVSVIRQLVNAQSLGSLLICEIIRQYNHVYRAHLDDILSLAESGVLSMDKQLAIIRISRGVDDLALVRTKLAEFIEAEKSP